MASVTTAPGAGRRTVVRVCLVLLAVTSAVLGVWAALAPRSFYDSFPGFGRHWVAIDGPFNEHLVRDFGNLNLALTVLTAVAAATMVRVFVQAVAAAWLVYSIPHLTYHLHHFDQLDTVDVVGNLVGLGAAIVLPIVVLVLSTSIVRPPSSA
jgi:hypothetical protein